MITQAEWNRRQRNSGMEIVLLALLRNKLIKNPDRLYCMDCPIYIYIYILVIYFRAQEQNFIKLTLINLLSFSSFNGMKAGNNIRLIFHESSLNFTSKVAIFVNRTSCNDLWSFVIYHE